jgi:arylsulfatase A
VVEFVGPAKQDPLTRRYTEEAVRFIRDNRRRPFFLYLPHTAVHVPLHPGEKFRGRSANGEFGDWVEELDWSVGRILDTVRALKLDRRTLVIFTSDNGPWLPQGRKGGVAGTLRGGKGSTWEGGVREPTVAWWPGVVRPGSNSDAMTANLDLLPTFVRLAGGAAPTGRAIDGVDITPILRGAAASSTREAHYFFNGDRLEAVRSGPWKLAVRPQVENRPGEKPIDRRPGAPPESRLYNLIDDLGETTDVSAQHLDVVARLKRLVAQMDADLGETGHGPGVRPPGRVANPVPLLLPGVDAARVPPARPQAAPPSH